ncbi:MAG: FitA-like ribbon-helix-helix domain-containing protein [Pseudonocardiaceae bacterium]
MRTLQIRDVPEDVHATVRIRAAQAGMSVSTYLLHLVTELVTRPTMAEVVERAKTLARAGGGTTRTDVQTAIRQSREH